MPRLTAEPLFSAPGLTLRRVTCDGVDPVRPSDEQNGEPRLIAVLHGRFGFDDSRTRTVASPLKALFLDRHHGYRISHLDGGDVCLVVQGDVCGEPGSAPTERAVSADGYVRLQALATRLRSGQGARRLRIEEEICTAIAPPEDRPIRRRPRDGDMAAAIAFRLERDIDARSSLREVTAELGASLFHACRVFRRETGYGIHQYQQEVRLRHALALVLDTNRPLAEVALETGFANQGHLTNLFRRRFGQTPARVRKAGASASTRATVFHSAHR